MFVVGKYLQTLRAGEKSIFQRILGCLSGVQSSELGLNTGMKNLEEMGEARPWSRHPEGFQMYFLNIKAAMTAR